MLDVGQAAPDFTLSDQDGNPVSLSALQGRQVVLYFYPKDNTPGCTKEACSFRDRFAELSDRGVVVLGVSPDSVASHRKFADKHTLPFTLLADPEHQVAEAFGAWGEKTLYGRKFMGLIRSTFLIDEAGVVRHVWKKPKTDIHADEVLAKL
ncbi:MAG: thioredoxin-dependent thiol peroxidase [Candidatus Sericytochromatia bacterium]